MPFPEKTNWVALLVAVPTLVVYAALVVPQVISRPLAEVEWVPPMLGAILVVLVANVVGNVLAAVSNPREADQSDERDREIDRFGERLGNWLIAFGAIGGLALAMRMAHPFWIANAIFLGFIAASIVSAIAKIAAYRGWGSSW